jgi:hypothetical protein
MLKEGLLWFDDDPRRSVVIKIRNAVERYEERFGIRPTFCYLNPAQMTNLRVLDLLLIGESSLGRNYFLVGYDTDQEAVVPQSAVPLRRRRSPASTRTTRARRASA